MIALVALMPVRAGAQERSGVVTVRAVSEAGPVAGARVSAGGTAAITDAGGEATLRLAAGRRTIRVQKLGFAAADITLVVREASDTAVVVRMEEEAVEEEAIIVTSTRADRRIEDEPVRVEVLPREEIEEKLLMTPGDIAMMLNETAGLRVQPTAPSLGGASVRIQGLRGRYTQILSDGLPLYGGQTGALGPLQIPPMDLGQVEVIKGVASALYGASALGGVVNLLSRRPAEEPERELLLNHTTLGGNDAIGWASEQLNERWGYTVLASGHGQAAADIDDDDWADVPSFRRGVLRPRLFWNGERANALFTAGGMLEVREGGSMPGRPGPAGTAFPETLDTRRFDGGGVVRVLLGEDRLLTVRGSAAAQRHEHRFGLPAVELDRHSTAFMEAALSGATAAHTWVLGAALQREGYDAPNVAEFDYTFTVPGVFAQDEYSPATWLTLSLSARLDRHSEYGTFLNPRLSALLRPRQEWSVRASVGTGYFAPTPWVEETEAVGLRRVAPPVGLEAERARNASLDVARTIGPFELNGTVFASRIDDAVQVRLAETGDRLELFNAEGDVRTHGTELLVRYHAEGVHVTATHVYLRSTEPDPDAIGRRVVPLTPEHTAGLVAALEREGRGRVGAEFYYTGRQQLEDNPYRTESEPHTILGFLAEAHFGRVRLFLNAENVTDTRQTRFDPLVLPARSPEGRWITDVWAPLEGRTFNAGVRVRF